MYANYKIARCIDVEEMKSPLRLLTLDVGEAESVTVVTNSSLVRAGSKYVVALPSAIVPAGADPASGSVVKPTNVGGRRSNGIICDAPMLGWGTGNANVPVFLNGEEWVVGGEPPPEKPGRPGEVGGGVGSGGEVEGGAEAEPLFEKKMTKEEKKAAAKAKREAKRAAKAAAEGK